MTIPKRMALAISGLTFAGATALTLGAAASAGAQTVTIAPHHSTGTVVTGGCWDDDCAGDWDDWDDDCDDC